MKELLDKIKTVESKSIDLVMHAVLERYRELFPDWDINVISVDKCDDRNAQLDQIIDLVQKLKD